MKKKAFFIVFEGLSFGEKMKNNTSFKKFKYNWNEKMEALQKNGHSQKVILNTKKKWLSSSILSF